MELSDYFDTIRYLVLLKIVLTKSITKPKFTSADITGFAWKTYQETPQNTQKHNKKERKTDKWGYMRCKSKWTIFYVTEVQWEYTDITPSNGMSGWNCSSNDNHEIICHGLPSRTRSITRDSTSDCKSIDTNLIVSIPWQIRWNCYSNDNRQSRNYLPWFAVANTIDNTQ